MTALAIYDFDGTMIRGDSIASYLSFAFRYGCLSPGRLMRAGLSVFLYKLRIISAGEAKRRALCFLDRLNDEKQRKLDTAFAAHLCHRIHPDALKQMDQDRAEGRKIIILSASTDNYMHPLADLLGADALICTKLNELPAGNCRGEAKVSRLYSWLTGQGFEPDWAASAAYGDSLSDMPVLDLTGHPALVNPAARTLRRLSRHYPILNWK